MLEARLRRNSKRQSTIEWEDSNKFVILGPSTKCSVSARRLWASLRQNELHEKLGEPGNLQNRSLWNSHSKNLFTRGVVLRHSGNVATVVGTHMAGQWIAAQCILSLHLSRNVRMFYLRRGVCQFRVTRPCSIFCNSQQHPIDLLNLKQQKQTYCGDRMFR